MAGVKVDDKVLVVQGPQRGMEGYVFGMVVSPAGIESVMVDFIGQEDDAMLLPCDVEVIGHYEIPD